MTKRSWNLLLIVLIVVAAVAAWWVYRPSAPVPEGAATLIKTTARGLETTSRVEPQCLKIATSQEGWYIGTTRVAFAQCKKCAIECRNSGTRSAGWYSTCGNKLVVYADCTEPVLPSQDQPFCRTSGSGEQWWYIGKRPIREASCAGCAVECRNVGTADEGWYDGCDDSLLVTALCGDAQ